MSLQLHASNEELHSTSADLSVALDRAGGAETSLSAAQATLKAAEASSRQAAENASGKADADLQAASEEFEVEKLAAAERLSEAVAELSAAKGKTEEFETGVEELNKRAQRFEELLQVAREVRRGYV